MSESTEEFDASNLPLSFDEPSGADYGDSPLIDFEGDGVGYYVKGGKSAKGRVWMRVNMRFNDIRVYDAVEVYPHPTAEISMFYSAPEETRRKKPGMGTSEWEILSESLRRIYGERYNEGLDDMFGGRVPNETAQAEKPGKRIRMSRQDSLVNVPGRTPDELAKMLEDGVITKEQQTSWLKYHDELKPAWVFTEVKGVGSSAVGGGQAASADDLMQHVLTLADGKEEKAFYEVAMDDQRVMGNPGLLLQLTNRTFVQQMKDLKMITQDDAGVLHKASN